MIRRTIYKGVFFLGMLLRLPEGETQTGSVLTSVPAGNDARSGYVFGYGFSIFTNDIRVTALGFYDKNNDGLAIYHDVGLYTPEGTIITSVTVQAGTAATLSNGYRYVFLSQPVLLYGSYGRVRYSLGAVNGTDSTDQASAGNFSYHWTVGDFIDGWISSSTLPTNGWIPSAGPSSVRFAPNALFEVVPITIRKMSSRSFIVTPIAAVASSQYSDRAPTRTINGTGLSDAQSVTNHAPIPNPWPTHDNAYTSIWTTSGGPNINEWIYFQFDQVYQIEGFHLWNDNGSGYTTRGPYYWQVSNSVDGVTWEAGPEYLPHALSQAPGDASYTGINISFAVPVRTKYIKLCRPRAVSSNHCGLSEIRFIGSDPVPAGAVFMLK